MLLSAAAALTGAGADTGASDFSRCFTRAIRSVVVSAAGWVSRPSVDDYTHVWLQIAYITFLGAVIAMFAWNTAVALIGPQNVSLFWSVVPVATFAIQIARGYRPHVLELAGGAVAIGALIGSNLLSRRREPAAPHLPRIPPLRGVRALTS